MTESCDSAASEGRLDEVKAAHERIHDDLRRLRDAVQSLARERLRRTGDRLRNAAAELGTGADDAMARILKDVAAKPERAAAVAFCVGCAAGLFLRRRRG